MLAQLTRRLLTEPDKRVLWKFLYNFGWKGTRAVAHCRQRQRRGGTFPAFLIISVTNNCNLRCQGCWVTPTQPVAELSPATLDAIIRASKKMGSYFFGLLGGEPLLYKGLFDVMGRHPDCYFQLFTNGTLLTDDVARELRRLGNVTPLVSVEGLETVSDQRRGGTDVFRKAMDGLEACRRHRLITGVASSVCKSNFREVVADTFLEDMKRRGVMYVWYYVYRPAGPAPAPELALSDDEIVALRRFMVEARCRAPVMIVDAYWDQDGRAICPAAAGISHHIGPAGDVEPCPPIQFAADRLHESADVAAVLDHSDYLRRFRSVSVGSNGGCILLQHPECLRAFVEQVAARDTTGRGRGLQELAAMTAHADHHLPGREIPEKHWLYRMAKRNWFFGFGAYG